MLKKSWIKQCVQKSEYYFSKHGDQERKNDNLTIIEIEETLLNGSVIEQYPDTGRGSSCLLAGFNKYENRLILFVGK
ncbi:MAG: DUF4258 domain-containing protein [Methylococcales symbiont of Hymedesmia sp. n. MRB-2018]|nr:MAG: DUF4258 domain-containing protein [Methylococcales symbiont of Hymedesmia sp. n. MRB-2018]KAF3984186.1 MAG: DUF4258 domain-containing protein [Methylococcales symbiont of Hymedesmia sp. n. MRB-2018]